MIGGCYTPLTQKVTTSETSNFQLSIEVHKFELEETIILTLQQKENKQRQHGKVQSSDHWTSEQ